MSSNKHVVHHTLEILKSYNAVIQSSQNVPLDAFIQRYFRLNKNVGSGERKAISFNVYGITRWLLLVDYLCKAQADAGAAAKQASEALLKKKRNVQSVDHSDQMWEKRLKIFSKLTTLGDAERLRQEGVVAEADDDLDNRNRMQQQQQSKPKQLKHDYDKDFVLPRRILEDRKIPLNVRASCPAPLFNAIVQEYGEDEALRICNTMNTQAPTFVRSNPLKVKRSQLLKKFANQHKFSVEPCEYSELGIKFNKRENFMALDEFKRGEFEIQDEASQLVANLVDAKPGDHVLDYCAGAGGKTLAFAHKLQGKGVIYMHDVRPAVLLEARKRLKRAGIQNAQPLAADHPQLKKLKGKMTWVIVDVPCSGTGTLRRNPDMKYKFNLKAIEELVEQQRQIFARALEFVKKPSSPAPAPAAAAAAAAAAAKTEAEAATATDNAANTKKKATQQQQQPQKSGADTTGTSNSSNSSATGGFIVYSTCSILRRENEEQIEYFLNKYPGLELVDISKSIPRGPSFVKHTHFFKSLPNVVGGMDGFFAAVMRWRDNHNNHHHQHNSSSSSNATTTTNATNAAAAAATATVASGGATKKKPKAKPKATA